MSKVSLIIEREYLSRVRKKSFIVMSILGPLLIASLYILPIVLANMDATSVRKIAVIDATGELKEALKDTKTVKYVFWNNMKLNAGKEKIAKGNHYALLFRSHGNKYDEKGLVLLSDKQMSLDVTQEIKTAIRKNVERERMHKLNISKETLDSIKAKINLETRKISKEGGDEASSAELAMGLGLIGALFVYFVIFFYAAQVMRGVIEEKSSRIVEVIISSAKPFQLMMGKIVGVSLVVLTQLAIWGTLTFGLISIAMPLLSEMGLDGAAAVADHQMVGGANVAELKKVNETGVFNNIVEKLSTLNLPVFLFGFVFYLIGGYLIYASLFAAVGAAVDSETDSQQFVLPISLPLILSFMVAMNMIREPDSVLAFWFSIIPLTSPVSMMVRLPFGVPTWELLLSMFLLVLMFIATTWFAGKIYRTGILMYGKKPSLKELWRWIRHTS